MNTPANQVDIYVDGAWLYRGSENPREAGGWGAVIVRSSGAGQKVRKLSGVAPAGVESSTGAEYQAIVSALNSVEQLEYTAFPKPVIIMHTDQYALIEHMNAVAKEKADPIKGKLGPLTDEITALSKQMKVSFAFETDPKGKMQDEAAPTPWISVAHQLANAMAWWARLDKQGYISLKERGRLEGAEAKAAIDGLMPVVGPNGPAATR